MKKAFAIIVFALIALFYCFAIEATPHIEDLGGDVSKEVTIEQYSFVSLPAAKLADGMFHCRTISKNTPIPFFTFSNYSYENFVRTVEYAEQLFASKFAQYSFFAINLLIEKKKSNLTFPNYYFW